MEEKLKSLSLVIASANLHKIREIKDILGVVKSLDLLSLLDFPEYTPPEEVGKTFKENAILKAESAAKALNKWVLADDSGLVVSALNGEPGVISARYAGEGASYLANRKKLLEKMKDLTDSDRAAYFECCIVIASPSGIKSLSFGSCEGEIAEKESGRDGFGYDPIFVKYGYRKSFAELPFDVKNQVSHRRKALDKVIPYLQSLVT